MTTAACHPPAGALSSTALPVGGDSSAPPTILELLEAASQGSGRLTFFPTGETVEYAELWETACGAASGLAAEYPESAALGIVVESSRASVTALLACWLSGLRTVSIPPALLGAIPELPPLVAVVGPSSALNAEPRTVTIDAESFVHNARSRTGGEILAGRSADLARDFDFLQFTSGSTGCPKGVRLGFDAIGANCVRMLERLTLDGPVTSVSWLPLSHDMGLVGMLMTSIAAFAPSLHGGGHAVLIDPAHFEFRPYSWLSACSELGAHVTCSPPSALAAALPWLARRPPGDLSSLQACIIGSEMFDYKLLSRTSAAFQALGIMPSAIRPAYGCAEMALAVSMAASAPQQTRYVDIGVELLVAAGEPLDGATVRIDSSAVSGELAQKGVGELVVSGESLMNGYLERGNVVEHRTGDLGIIVDNQLVPYGRVDDWITLRNHVIYAGDFERAGAVLPVRRNCVCAVTVEDELVVVYESKRNLDLTTEINSLATRHLGAPPDRIVRLRKNEFPLTASGKLRRSDAQFVAASILRLSAGRSVRC